LSDLSLRAKTTIGQVSKVAVKAGSLLVLRLTWLQVLLLPLPALIGLLVGVGALLAPRRSAALRPIRDLLGTGAQP
jgi:hypothetical protein